MESKIVDIEYQYFSKGKFFSFTGTTRYPDNMSLVDLYKQVVKEHPEHDIIFSSFKFNNLLYIRDLIYIG